MKDPSGWSVHGAEPPAGEGEQLREHGVGGTPRVDDDVRAGPMTEVRDADDPGSDALDRDRGGDQVHRGDAASVHADPDEAAAGLGRAGVGGRGHRVRLPVAGHVDPHVRPRQRASYHRLLARALRRADDLRPGLHRRPAARHRDQADQADAGAHEAAKTHLRLPPCR
jgi:hypothetical protein